MDTSVAKVFLNHKEHPVVLATTVTTGHPGFNTQITRVVAKGRWGNNEIGVLSVVMANGNVGAYKQ